MSMDLKNIDDLKAPGCDGLNTPFFKKSWSILGENITNGVLIFFETTNIFLPINCTLVKLIPKVKHPYSVKKYRSISCCNILYKIISKILTKILQGVMES